MNIKDFTELNEYPNYFIAHSPARIIRLKSGKFVECSQCSSSKKDPYWTTTLKDKEGKFVKRSIHRLLAQTFIPNPENKGHVNHIDADKTNNTLSNLEWATPAENSNHAYKLGLYPDNSKGVHQYYLNGTYIQSFDSDVLAEEATGIPRQNISKSVLGNRIHAGYFRWSRDKHPSLLPIKHSYIRGYTYKGKKYNSLKELGTELGLSCPEKASWSRFSKNIKSHITKNYYI